MVPYKPIVYVINVIKSVFNKVCSVENGGFY